MTGSLATQRDRTRLGKTFRGEVVPITRNCCHPCPLGSSLPEGAAVFHRI